MARIRPTAEARKEAIAQSYNQRFEETDSRLSFFLDATRTVRVIFIIFILLNTSDTKGPFVP